MQMKFRVFGGNHRDRKMIRSIISSSTDIWLANNSRNAWSKRYVSRWVEHSENTRMVWWEHRHTGINKASHCALITCSKAVLDLKANPLQLFITEEADPHEASTGEDESRTGRATEAIDEWREAEGAVPHLDVVETTLKWGLDVEGLIKQQLYPLAGQGWGKQSAVSHLLPQRRFRSIMRPQNGSAVKNAFAPFKFLKSYQVCAHTGRNIHKNIHHCKVCTMSGSK